MRPFVKVLRKQYPPLVSKKQHCQRQLCFPGVVCCPSTHQDRLSCAALGLLSTTARGKYGIQPWRYACYCVTLSRAGLHLTITTSEKGQINGLVLIQCRRGGTHAQSPWEVNILQVTSGTMAEPRLLFKPVRLWFHYRPLTHRSAFTSQTARTGSRSQKHRLPVWSLLWSHPHGAMQGGWVA